MSLIINEGDKTDEDYTTNAIINVEETTLSDEEKEFENIASCMKKHLERKYILQNQV